MDVVHAPWLSLDMDRCPSNLITMVINNKGMITMVIWGVASQRANTLSSDPRRENRTRTGTHPPRGFCGIRRDLSNVLGSNRDGVQRAVYPYADTYRDGATSLYRRTFAGAPVATDSRTLAVSRFPPCVPPRQAGRLRVCPLAGFSRVACCTIRNAPWLKSSGSVFFAGAFFFVAIIAP